MAGCARKPQSLDGGDKARSGWGARLYNSENASYPGTGYSASDTMDRRIMARLAAISRYHAPKLQQFGGPGRSTSRYRATIFPRSQEGTDGKDA